MRFILLSLLALLLIQPALAQGDFGFGFRAGVNASSLDPDYSDTPLDDIDLGIESRLGFGASAFAELSFHDNLSAVAEASYTRRGYSYPIIFGTIEESIEERGSTSMDFASLGVLGRVLPFGRLPYAPYAVVGPRVDALLGSDPGRVAVPEGSGLPEGAPDFYEDELAPLFADVSLSGVLGLGVAMTRMNWPELRAEIRYGRTLTDFFTDAPVEGGVTGFDFSVGVAW